MKDNEVQGKLLTNKQVDQIMDWMFEFAEGGVDSTAVLSNLHFSLVVEDEFPTGRILSFQSTPEGGFCPDETGGLPVEDEVMSRDQAKKVLRGLGLGELNEAPPGGYSLTSLEEARIPRDAWWKVESMDVDQLHPKTQAEVTKRKILEFINKYPKINNTQLLGLSNCISWLEQE